MTSVSRQRVLYVTGKGGVGKSTVAAALACHQARQGREVVLIEFEGSVAAARALGDETLGVRHLTIEYLDALVEVLTTVLGSRLLSRMLVNHRAVRRLVRAIPALRELSILHRIRTLLAERPGLSAVVDLPATGHSLDWLRVPVAAQRFLRKGPAAELCAALRQDILSPDVSAIVVVSTVEPVVASETRQLCQRLAQELERSPSLLVANRVPYAPTSVQLDRVEQHVAADPGWEPLLRIAREDRQRAEDAEQALGDLSRVAGAPLRSIPELPTDPTPSDVLRYLGDLG